MRRPPHVLQSLLLLLVMVVAIAAADHCPDSQQPQPAFGSSRHLVGLVVFATCELLDQAVKPSPAEVRRYLQDATDTADDDQIDWHANYSCPEDGQDDAYPAAVSRQLSPAASSQDTVFDLPVAVAAAAADCFSEAAGESACAACADALHLRARLRAALSAQADQLHDAVARAAAPHSCSSGAGGEEDDACTAALDDATAESLQRAVGDALGAARQVGGRARQAAAAAQLSDTVAGMLAHSAHQPVAADEAQPASAASQQTANCAALLVSAAALHPARFLV